MRKIIIRKFALIVLFLFSAQAVFASNTFELATASLPAHPAPANAATPTPFTTINFVTPFDAPPNVFTLTPEFGAGADDDPCTIRIRNITTTGFEATCLEPINEDRASPGLLFDYLAVADGGVTVPLDDGTGDVEFRSACVDTNEQVFGPNCDNCSGAQAFVPVGFGAPAFNNTPALLTQIQTTENLINGEPIFIEAAVQSGSLSTTGFNVSLDQLEAGVGPIANDESICYLAVEQDGCQELDLSSLGGPTSPITFNAVVSGNVIDGHDNGCTSGEGASFAAGCFTQTPVALASQNTRNGNNGGILRSCSVNANEIVLTVDEDRVSNTERSHIDEIASVLAFSSTFTTPVTLNRMQISQLGRRTFFEWETSAETFHLGFDLWGEENGEWIQLNRKIIAGSGIDADGVTTYQSRVTLTQDQADTIERFGISSIDNTGAEEFYGPFEVGQEYGEQANNESIDWSETREKFNRVMAEQGYIRINNRWQRVSASRLARLQARDLSIGARVFALRPQQAGIHNIDAQSLLNLNPSWQGVALNKIALVLNGKALPRHIISEDAFFSADDRIVFNAIRPQGVDAIYQQNYTYQLKLDGRLDVDASGFDGRVDSNDELSEQTLVAQQISSDQQHSSFLTNGDPYFDRQISAFGSSAETSYSFDFDQTINADGAGQIDFELVGGINFPGEVDEPDHHVQIVVNDTMVFDQRFDGLETLSASVDLPQGLLQQQGNNLRIILPGDTGFFADRVIVDEVSVAAMTPLSELNNYEFRDSGDANGYQVELTANADQAEVYAFTNTGALSSIQPSSDNADTVRFASLPFAANQERGIELSYAVATRDAWATVDDISVVRAETLHQEPADYLLVAHPNFIGDKLDEFIELKTEQGLVVRTVDWLSIVDTYGYGNDTPRALDNFLARARSEFEFDNVLLVGGHTYDYRGVSGQAVINYIPAHYREVNIFKFAPTDNPYADLDGDNLPEVAIGRWAVRDEQDLAAIVDKTKAWHQNRNDDIYQSALLISQPTDSRGLNFSDQINGRVGFPLAELTEFSEVANVSLQDAIDSGAQDPVAQTRAQIKAAINTGSDLISFNGHGSTAAWGFQGVVNTEFVQSLDNAGQPVIVMPLACYTTYYESPTVNSLAHQWMFAGDTGAVAVHGASVLGEFRENAIFAERYLRHSKDATTVGQAIKNAKRAMASSNSMLHNWALLGDPALPVR